MSSFFYAVVPEEIQERRDLCALIRLCGEGGGDEALDDASNSSEKSDFLFAREETVVGFDGDARRDAVTRRNFGE